MDKNLLKFHPEVRDALAAGRPVVALAGDAPLRERLGSAGRELHRTTYNYREYRRRLAAVYVQLLGAAADVCRSPDTL